MAVHRHAHRHVGRQSAVCRAGGALAASKIHRDQLPLFCRQPAALCRGTALGQRRAGHLDRSGVFYLGLGFQSLRGFGVLGDDGRRIRRRSRQAALRGHRRGSDSRRDFRLERHRGAGETSIAHVSFVRLRVVAGAGGFLCAPALAFVRACISGRRWPMAKRRSAARCLPVWLMRSTPLS